MSEVLTRLRYLSRGAPLRVVHGRTTEGTFAEVNADALVIARGKVMERIPAAEITAVYRKASHVWHGALLGAMLGLGLGAFLALKATFLTVGFIGLQGGLIIIGIIAIMVALFGAALGAWIPRWTRIWP